MCIRDRTTIVTSGDGRLWSPAGVIPFGHVQALSLIHISEPTRLGMISYAVFCLKKKRPPPRSTQSRSSAASDVYKRQDHDRHQWRRPPLEPRRCHTVRSRPGPVSYTHLRAHETRHDLVCRLLLEKKTATTEIYTE